MTYFNYKVNLMSRVKSNTKSLYSKTQLRDKTPKIILKVIKFAISSCGPRSSSSSSSSSSISSISSSSSSSSCCCCSSGSKSSLKHTNTI